MTLISTRYPIPPGHAARFAVFLGTLLATCVCAAVGRKFYLLTSYECCIAVNRLTGFRVCTMKVSINVIKLITFCR